jgi:hypothetical protein
MFDEKPVGSFLAVARPHAREYPASSELVSLKCKVEFSLAVAILRVFAFPIATVPQHHCAAAILAFRDCAFEITVIKRVILDFDGKTLVSGIERRSFRHRPGFEDAVDFQTEIVMQARGYVLLNDKTQAFFEALTRLVPRGSFVLSKSRLA